MTPLLYKLFISHINRPQGIRLETVSLWMFFVAECFPTRLPRRRNTEETFYLFGSWQIIIIIIVVFSMNIKHDYCRHESD